MIQGVGMRRRSVWISEVGPKADEGCPYWTQAGGDLKQTEGEEAM